MTNKDLFMKSTLKRREWTSPDTGAVFIVQEPNARLLVELVRLAGAKGEEVEKLDKVLRFIWGNLMYDAETGRRAFLPSDVDALFEIKELEELSGPLNIVMELCGLQVPAEVLSKN